MKLKLKIGYLDNPDNNWVEDYDVDVENPQSYAEEMIASFNATLRPGEKERILLEVIVADKESIEKHAWYKINLTTIVLAGGINYDKQKCSRCGVTGKRYGLSKYVKIDAKYKAKVYQRCDTAQKHLENEGNDKRI